ncbi:MAG: hypothetical protein IPJ08_10495 [Burkholderiales bacterium]|nr:hypothetical protein [Burkholderiales bacterium]
MNALQCRTPWPRTLAPIVVTVVLLTACGGTSDSSPPVTQTTTVTLTGVVATGLAVSGATVNAKCATGTGTATSASDGSYASTLSAGAKLPCALEVTLADGSKLHSVTADAGTSTTSGNDTATSVKAHVTPATELIVTALAGGDSAAFFSGFDATAATKVTDATVAAANTAAVELLKKGGVDLSGAGNLLNAPLTASAGGTTGNPYDQALDALAAKLTATGSTLADLRQAIEVTPIPGLPAPAPKAVASLPGDLLLLDGATNCKALRSTTYRIVIPHYGGDLGSQTTQLSIDAKTLKVTNLSSGVVDTWQPNGDCRFIANAGTSAPVDVVVTPAGLLVGRPYFETEAQYRLAVGFPEQAHTLAELAGDWNGLGREMLSGTGIADATYTGFTGDFSVSSAGAVLAANFCVGTLTTCSPQTDAMAFSLNATVTPSTGGFDMSNAGNSTRRAYAYRAGGGELLVLAYGPAGSFNLWTRKTDGSLPAAGSSVANWGLPSNTNGVAGTLADAAFTNNAGSGNSYTRLSLIDGHTETLQINTPRSGYLFRAQDTATSNANAPVTVNEFTALGLRGMGLAALWIPAQGTGGGVYLSPNKPTDTGNAAVAHELLGKSYAPTCAALRSGSYRVVRLHNGSAEVFTSSLNAATLTFNAAASPNWTASPTEACRFSNPSGTVDAVVSQAGVFVNRITDSTTGTRYLAIGFPEQTHTLADLQGDWNVTGLARNSTANGYNGITATASIDATGVGTATTWCENEATRSVAGADCQAVATALPTYAINAAGGFDVSSGGQLFLYTSATGKMVMKANQDGSVQIGTPVQTLSATVGRINKQWDVSVNNVMDANAEIGLSSFTNKAYDADTGTLTRTSNDDGHEQVVMQNNPRAGFSHRAPIVDAPTTNPVGTVQVREFTALNLREAAGITAQWRPQLMADQVATNARGRLQISVQVP